MVRGMFDQPEPEDVEGCSHSPDFKAGSPRPRGAPEGDLAPDLELEPLGTTQPRGPTQDRRDPDLPWSGLDVRPIGAVLMSTTTSEPGRCAPRA